MNFFARDSHLCSGLNRLEYVPKVSAKLKDPNTGERKFEDLVKSADQAAVLGLAY